MIKRTLSPLASFWLSLRNRLDGVNILVTSICVLFFLILCAYILYTILGHALIETIYEGQSARYLNRFIVGQKVHPVDHYVEYADRLAWRALFWFAVLATLLIIVVVKRLYKEVALSLSSFFLFSFMVFLLLDLFPIIPSYLHLDSSEIQYYKYKDRFISDRELVFRHRPSTTFRTHSFRGGHYSPEFAVDVPPTTYQAKFDADGFRNEEAEGATSDIVVIGDSFIEIGHTEKDTFSKRLELHSGLTTANLGIGGYGPFQYLKVLKKYGLVRRPKYALFAFFEGNDLMDIREYLQWREGTGDYYRLGLLAQGVWGKYQSVWADLSRWIFEGTNSRIDYLRHVLLPITKRDLVEKSEIHPRLVVVNLGNSQFKDLFFYRNLLERPDEILNSEEVSHLKTILVEFKEFCRKNNIIPLVMFIPIKAHIYAEHTTHESGQLWKEIRDEQISAKSNVERVIRALCLKLSLQLVNLSPVFESAARGGKILYYPFDDHWNSTGREIAAAHVAGLFKNKRVGIPIPTTPSTHSPPLPDPGTKPPSPPPS